MARRRQSEAALSFFAFQDVMLGVIGVVILLTIVLLLQRATGLLEPITDDLLVGGETERSLSMPKVTVRTEVIEASAGDRATRRLEIRELESDLQSTATLLDALRARIRRLTDEFNLGGGSRAVTEAIERIGDLQARLGEVEERRRITYLLSEADGWTPMVVEIADGRAIMSRPQGEMPALAISAATPDALANRIARFANAEIGPREYLLLVVKPSGIATYYALPLDQWEERGIRTGLDLIPESSATTDEFPAVRP